MNQEQYNRLRKRLIMFFNRRGCLLADDLADETLFRLLTKLKSGAVVSTQDLERYAMGIAKNIWHENNRNPLHIAATFENPTVGLPIEIPSGDAEVLQLLLDETTRRCVNTCLKNKLTEDERRLILNYFKDDWHEQVESRKRLVKELGITADGLRIRAMRILRKLNDCATKCLGGKYKTN